MKGKSSSLVFIHILNMNSVLICVLIFKQTSSSLDFYLQKPIGRGVLMDGFVRRDMMLLPALPLCRRLSHGCGLCLGKCCLLPELHLRAAGGWYCPLWGQ